MERDPAQKVYGILGYPVKHSFSPAMHTAAFAHLGIKAEYKLFEKRPEEVEDFLRSLKSKGIFGLNVTIPYKEKVLDAVELESESFYLRQIGAVNTILVEGNSLKGFNTDIPGFLRHLKENTDPAGKTVALLGAGGGARAVAYALAKSKAAGIVIYDIDAKKAKGIADMIETLFHGFNFRIAKEIQDLEINKKDILINTTPVGMKESDPCLISADELHSGLFVYDLIYNPQETKLLRMAKQAGLSCANGLRMLLYQGALSFKIWTGQDAPEELMWEALQKELKLCRN